MPRAAREPSVVGAAEITSKHRLPVAESWACSRGSQRSGADSHLLNAMTELGHDQFAVVGHDRGRYYALQMALGYPDRVTRAALLDCLPISEHLE